MNRIGFVAAAHRGEPSGAFGPEGLRPAASDRDPPHFIRWWTRRGLEIRRLAIVSITCLMPLAAAPGQADPIPLIFDTDIGNDVDDVLALGMIHALQDRQECRLLAVTVTKDHPLAGPFTDAVNTFYGRGEIPIGVSKGNVTPDEGKFLGLATVLDGGTLRYPHDYLHEHDGPSAVEVLRRALHDAEDNRVVIVQVGFSTNLADLLSSESDAISPLNGIDLVRRKVRRLSVMGGAFRPIPDERGNLGEHYEYNIVNNIPAAQRLAADWPTPITWSGFEIGLALPYPHESIELDYEYVPHHPLAEAYRLYNPPPHDRPTWDLTSVLHAVRPDRGYFDLSPAGRVHVADDGRTTFQVMDQGTHRHLVLTDEQRVRVPEALTQLSSQPPR